MKTGLLLQVLLMCVIHCMREGNTNKESMCIQSRCKGDICEDGICSKGCKDGFYQTSCRYNCSRGCIALRCRDSGAGTGICTDGCRPGLWGESCSSHCPGTCKTCSQETGNDCTSCQEFHYGLICEKDCRASCPSSGCDRNGTCKQDSYSLACDNGKFGPDCEWSCPVNCAYGACNRTSGLCLHGCKRGYFGENCEFGCNVNCLGGICNNQGQCIDGCKPGFYGYDCKSQCELTCCMHLCNRGTGDCTNGCTSGYHGEHCNLTCSVGCSVCNRKTGMCLETGIHKSCEADEFSEDSDVNKLSLTGYYILGCFVILSLCGAITGILVRRRYRTSMNRRQEREMQEIPDAPRRLPDLPVELYKYEYDEINENEMTHSSGEDGDAYTDMSISICSHDHRITSLECPGSLLTSYKAFSEGESCCLEQGLSDREPGRNCQTALLMGSQTEGVLENTKNAKRRDDNPKVIRDKRPQIYFCTNV